MARTTQGGAYEARGRYFMRVTIAAGQRRAVALPWVTASLWEAHAPGDAPCPCVACVRARDVQALVTTYRAGGADLEMLEALLKSAASADAEKMAAIGRAIAGFCEGKIPKAKPSPVSAKNTIRGIGERWTSGELHRLYRDHVRDKKSATDDGYRLETLCETRIADIPVERLTLDDADAAMGELDAVRQRIEDRRAKARGGAPRQLAPLGAGGRRQYAQMVSRICAMAVYPLKLIAVSPIPKGWLPRVPNDKAKGLVYPDEESAFLSDATHAIHWRMFFGFLARAGFRADEGAGLTLDAVDVERGIIRLDENKTDDARAPTYVDVPGFVDALAWWKATYRKDAPPEAPFFVQPNGERIRVDGLAERYRTMLETTLRAAGLYRAELFVGGDRRMKVRVHDLRGAFVTYALANGRTETWVMDRTGHRSSHMVNRYRRVARTVAEAELGDLTPLDEAIPEVAAASTAAEAAARPKALDEKPHRTYRKHVANGPIAQSVELRTFNP
jgi:integrase